jgi:hypothetical protein
MRFADGCCCIHPTLVTNGEMVTTRNFTYKTERCTNMFFFQILHIQIIKVVESPSMNDRADLDIRPCRSNLRRSDVRATSR